MPSFLCLMTRVYLCTSDTLASFTIPSLLASKTLRIHSSFCHLLGSPLMSQETLPANRSRKSKCRVPLILKVASGFLFYQNWIDGTYSGLSVDSQVAQWTACQCRRHRRPTWVPSLGQEGIRWEMAARSGLLAWWNILWTDKPGGLQSMGSQRVWYDLLTYYSIAYTHSF